MVKPIQNKDLLEKPPPAESFQLRLAKIIKESKSPLVTIFCLSIVFLGAGGATAVAGALVEDKAWLYVGLAAFVCALASVIGIVYLSPKAMLTRQAVINSPDHNAPLDEILKHVNDAVNNISDLTFRDIMADLLWEIAIKTRSLKAGQVDTQGQRSVDILNAVCAGASNVFFCCDKDTERAWHGKLGHELRKITSNGSTKQVSRVFLFDTSEEINKSITDEMVNQQRSGTKVLVRNNETVAGRDLVGAIEPNFVFINNGEIIGKIHSVTASDMVIQWHFQDEVLKRAYRQSVKLLQNCEVFVAPVELKSTNTGAAADETGSKDASKAPHLQSNRAA